MGPSFKRQRFSESSSPSTDIHARRAQNDMRLKSIFESIFEKYGRDFDGIGDEIDMTTGKIVVDNGHIKSMANERDIGTAETSSEELGYTDGEDDHSSLAYSEEHPRAFGLSKTEDMAMIEDSETSELLDFGADSLMGHAPTDSRLHRLGSRFRKSFPTSSYDEGDELASSDAEQISQKKNRTGVRERLSFSRDQYASEDEPAADPLWRAPPLPNATRLENRREQVQLPAIHHSRDCSDDERAGISLWTPEVKKRSRRGGRNLNLIDRRSLSFSRDKENDTDRLSSNLSDYEPASRKVIKWTQKEDDLLAYLKMNTTLSGTDMERYFPDRRGATILSHWYYMIKCGKATPVRQGSILSEPENRPSQFSSDAGSPGFNDIDPESHDFDESPKAKNLQTLQQQMKWKSPGTGNLLRSSSKPSEHFVDHHNRLSQVDRDCRRTNGDVDGSIFINIDDYGVENAKSVGNQVSSVTTYGSRKNEIRDQVYPNEVNAAVVLPHSLSQSSEIEHKSSVRKINAASKATDGLHKAVSQDRYRSQIISHSTPSKAQPNLEDAKPYSDSTISPKMQPQSPTVLDSNVARQQTASHSELQDADSVRVTADGNKHTTRSAEELRRSRTKDLDASISAQPADHGIACEYNESDVKMVSKKEIPRHIVQVVIPAKSRAFTKRARPALADVESEDSVFIRRRPGTSGCVDNPLDPNSFHQKNTVIRTPTRSPSVIALESQYAVSTGFAVKDVSSSLSIEIADSQPLKTTPVRATPAPRPGDEASRPIILDNASPPINMTPQTAPSIRKQPKKVSDIKTLAWETQFLRGIVSAARIPMEQAAESKIIKSSPQIRSKPLSAMHSPLKRDKKEISGDKFRPKLLAADDYSEDELSYL